MIQGFSFLFPNRLSNVSLGNRPATSQTGGEVKENPQACFELWCIQNNKEREALFDGIFKRLETRHSSFLSYPIDDKLFAHILCSDIIADSPFEGITSTGCLNYLNFILSKIDSCISNQNASKYGLSELIKVFGESHELFQLTHSAEDIDQKVPLAITHVREKIIALKPNQVFILPFGWKGHAMLAEIHKSRVGTYDFCCFNSGDGAKYNAICSDYKLRNQGYVHIAGISEENILCPVFWETYFDIFLHEYDSFERIKPKDVYKKLLFLLNGQWLDRDPEDFRIIPQRSGNCVWAVFKLYIKRFMSTIFAQKLLLHIKFWTLAAYIHQNKNEHLNGFQKQFLEWGSRKLAKDAATIYQGILGKDGNEQREFDLDSCWSLSGHYSDTLSVLALGHQAEKLAHRSFSKPAIQPPNTFLKSFDKEKWIHSQNLKSLFLSNRLFESFDGNQPLVHPLGRKARIESFETSSLAILTTLKEQLASIEEYENNPIVALTLLEKVIVSLPLPSDNLNSDQTTLLELRSLFICYLKFLIQAQTKGHSFVNQSRVYLYFYHLFSLVEQMASNLSEEAELGLRNYAIRFKIFDYLFDKKGLRPCFNLPKEHINFAQLRKHYLKKKREGNPHLFDYPGINKAVVSVERNSHKVISDFKFLEKYIKKNRIKFTHKIARSESHHQVSYVFANENLLPLGYSTLREIACYIRWYDADYLAASSQFIPRDRILQFLKNKQNPFTFSLPLDYLDEAKFTISLTLRESSSTCPVSFAVEDLDEDLLLGILYRDENNKCLLMFPQNEGLAGKARELSYFSDILTKQRAVEILASGDLKLHHGIQAFLENPLLYEEGGSLLNYIFLEVGMLLKNIRRMPSLSDHIELLFKKLLDIYLEKNPRIDLACHLIELILKIDHLLGCAFCFQEKLNITHWLSRLFNDVKKSENNELLPKVHFLHIAMYRYKRSFSVEEATSTIFHMLQLNRLELSAPLKLEIERAYSDLSFALGLSLKQQPDRVLNDVIFHLIEDSRSYRWEQENGVFACDSYVFSLAECNLYHKSKGFLGRLPDEFKEQYRRLFNLQPEPEFYCSKHRVESFDGIITLRRNNSATIKLQGKIYNIHPLGPLKDKLGLSQDGWHIRTIKNEENKFWICFQLGQPVYQCEVLATNNKTVDFTIKDLQEDLYLLDFDQLKTNKANIPLSILRLLDLEVSDKLLMWVNQEGHIKKIELNSYSILLNHIEGVFYVASDGPLKGGALVFDHFPFFDHFSNYLVIRKGGKNYLLIPNASFRLADTHPKKMVVVGCYSSIKPAYIYELQEGQPIPSTLAERMFLALIYAYSKKFVASKRLLKRCWKDTLYSKEERMLFKRFEEHLVYSSFNHKEPDVYALLSYLYLMRMQNVSVNHAAFKNSSLRCAAGYYLDYLDCLGMVSADLRLVASEERFLIGNFLNNIKPEERAYDQLQFRQDVLQGDEENLAITYHDDKGVNPFNSLKEVLFCEIPPEVVKSFSTNVLVPHHYANPHAPFSSHSYARQQIDIPAHFRFYLELIFSEDRLMHMSVLRDLLFYDFTEADTLGTYGLQILIHSYLNRDFLKKVKIESNTYEKSLNWLVGWLNSNRRKIKKTFAQFFSRSSEQRDSFHGKFYDNRLPIGWDSIRIDLNPPDQLHSSCSNADENEKPSFMGILQQFLRLQEHHTSDAFAFPLAFLPGTPAFKKLSKSRLGLKALDVQKELYSSYEQKVVFIERHHREKQLYRLINLLKEKEEQLNQKIKTEIDDLEQACNRWGHLRRELLNDDYHASMLLNESQALIAFLERQSQSRRKVTLHDCMISMLKGSLSTFLKKQNPFLTSNEIESIEKQLISIAAMQVELKHIQDSLPPIRELWGTKGESQDEQRCLSVVFQKAHAFSLQRKTIDNGPFFAFQVLTGINLRAKQYEVLSTCTKTSLSHALFQLMMGDGKTQVILPALALMLARNGNIPIILTPSSQYTQTTSDLRRFVNSTVDQHVYEFLFSRANNNNNHDIQRLYAILLEAAATNGCLVSTPESIQALVLTYIDYCLFPKVRDGEFSLKFNHLKKIVRMLKKHGIGVGDEAHKYLHSLKELVFSVDKEEKLKEDQYFLSLKIYEAMIEESHDFFENSIGSHFKDSDLSWITLREKIIKKIVEQVFKISAHTSLHQQTVDYLKGKNRNTQFITDLESHQPFLANDIVRFKEQLHSFLPYSLSRVLNVHYGYKKGELQAVPYSGNNAPNEHTDFGHIYVLQNLTIQMYLQLGISEDQFKWCLTELKRQWIKDQSLDSNNPKSVANQTINELFDQGFDIGTTHLDDYELLQELHQRYGKKRTIIFHFLRRWVFPQISNTPSLLLSNAFDLSDLAFKRFIAFTGTPYNLNAYSKKLVDNSQLDLPSQGRLLRVLLQKQNQEVLLTLSNKKEDLLISIRNLFQRYPNLRMVTDLGFFFDGVSNREIAQGILEVLPEMESVVFFEDHRSEMIKLTRSGDSPYFPQKNVPHNQFTFLDQLHAFGSDVKQMKEALQVVTFNKKLLQYELIQAAKRLRELEEGHQRVVYLIDQKTAEEVVHAFEIPGDKLTATHLMQYAFINEQQQVEQEILLSSMLQIQHVVRKHLFSKYVFSSHLRKEHQEILKKFFILQHKDEPCKQFKEFEEWMKPLDILQLFKERVVGPYSHIIEESKNEEINHLITHACGLLPDVVATRNSFKMNKEIEKQEEKHCQHETEVVAKYLYSPFYELDWHVKDLLEHGFRLCRMSELNNVEPTRSPRLFALNNWLKMMGKEPVFDEVIWATQNYLKTFEEAISSLDLPLKTVRYYLAYQINGATRVILLSVREADLIYRQLHKISLKDEQYLALRDISGHALIELGTPYDQSLFFRYEVQMQFFDGREQYKKEHKPLLRQWAERFERDKLADTFGSLYLNRCHHRNYGLGNLFSTIYRSKRKAKKQLTPNSLSKRVHREATISKDKGKDKVT
ncbi:MAG: DUF3638 domain-containing protein [Parachlamydiaceae bacterium]